MTLLFLDNTQGLDESIAPSFEERRLENVLPHHSTPFSIQILHAAKFEHFAQALADALCRQTPITSFEDAKAVIRHSGKTLWKAAVDRVQGRDVKGNLPQSDDRMLYWARLQMSLIVRRWIPPFPLNEKERSKLIRTLERASRGQYSLSFPDDPRIKRILISGFDPFTLGTPGASFPSSAIRIGNPSGAVALALNGKHIRLGNGQSAVIGAYLLPVSYRPFQEGMQENTIAKFFEGENPVAASITLSQGGYNAFWIEQWHGRYHAAGTSDNEGITLKPGLPSEVNCNIYPPTDVLGYNPYPWRQHLPKQFTATTLPVDAIIRANTGQSVIHPETHAPGGFNVIWHTNYSSFPKADNFDIEHFNTNSAYESYPPALQPSAPKHHECAYAGGGGNYLSNESGYRNTLLRDLKNSTTLAGHLHIPVMSIFKQGNDSVLTDVLFEKHRNSIVQQTEAIIKVIASAL